MGALKTPDFKTSSLYVDIKQTIFFCHVKERVVNHIMRLFLFALASVVASVSQSSSACIYFDAKIKMSAFKENDREALLFHDGEAANLILKTGFTGKLPSKLAWVFPVASKPIGYKVTSNQIFKTLNNIIGRSYDGVPAGRSLGAAPKAVKSTGIKVHEATQVGQYEIIPIEILSESSGRELNDWLKNQGFNTSPIEIQKPYLKKGAYFLAIRADLTGTISDIEPLWIRYKSDQLSFPLRLTHDYRSFNLKVYFLTTNGNNISVPKGRGWDDAPKGRIILDKVDRFTDYPHTDSNGKLSVAPGDDKFEALMNLLIEFREDPVVSKFLDRKDLVLKRIMIKGVNVDKGSNLLRTRNLTSDPSEYPTRP
jgi:hypothetical protein